MGDVCRQCLEARSDQIELLTKPCLELDKHDNADLLQASLTWDGRIKKVRRCHSGLPIREMPRAFFKGKFKICFGKSRCRGEACTYAHNKAELESWNKKLLGSLHTTFKGVPNSHVTSTLEATLKKLRERRLGQESSTEQPPEPDDADISPGVAALQSTLAQQTQEQATKFKPSPKFVHQPKFQHQKDTDHDIACIKDPLGRDNYQKKFKALLKCEQEDHNVILQQKCEGDYTLVLHQAGAKKPQWMKKEARRELKRFGYLKGLSGDKIAYAAQAAQGVLFIDKRSIICSADILQENSGSTTERLHVAFDETNLKKCKKFFGLAKDARDCATLKVHVHFRLKYVYFRNLTWAVDNIDVKIIEKIMPDEESLAPIEGSVLQHAEYLHKCSPDQSKALQAIASCPSSGPPILVTGPFGTGKTYILALSANYLFESYKRQGRPARVLVCTQQRVSADSFLDCYRNLMASERIAEVCVIRDYGYVQKELRQYHKTCEEFYGVLSRNSYRDRTSYLIITTCLTAPKLEEFLQPGFFTHIMIDEGAQMREPEAISPLLLASEKTQIVIAGDHQQVGPSMLVLGDKAQENGLAVSLLERLVLLYRSMGQCAEHYMVNLVNNYRCHEEIIKFSGNLFYDSQPQLPENHDPPLTHPLYPYPLYFICSSVGESTSEINSFTNKKEVMIIIEEIQKIASSWPTHKWGPIALHNVCILSTSRSQLTVVSQVIRTQQLSSKLKDVIRKSTYEMQGREFRVLILSTHEPTNSDSSTRDPTKTFCDRHIFNTAITRAQSLVISVGNPFVLLAMEKCAATKCWSNYLLQCRKHETFLFHDSLKLSEEEKRKCISKVDTMIQERLPEQACPRTSHIKDSPPTTKILPSDHDSDMSQEPVTSDTQSSDIIVFSPTEETFSLPSGSQTENEDLESQNETEEKPIPQSKSTTYMGFTKEYSIVKKLGKGGFGHVFQVLSKTDNAEYAIKIIRLPNDTKKQEQKCREVQTSARCCQRHTNIVPYYHSWIESTEMFQTDEWWTELNESQSGYSDGKSNSKDSSLSLDQVLFIKTALCQEDTLRDWLRNNTEKDTRVQACVHRFFEQILGALDHIHQMKIVHRDLKPSNIFFSKDEQNVIQVGDFGLATTFATTTDDSEVQSCSNYPYGTRLYMSPEQKSGERCDNKTDMYALGVVLFELWCPMKTEMERFKVLTELEEHRPKFCDQLPDEVADIVQLLMKEKPTERPAASDLQDSDKMKKLRKRLRKHPKKCVPLL